MTPAAHWAASPPAINLGVALPSPAQASTATVAPNGTVAVGRYLIAVGSQWAGQAARIHDDQTHAAVFIGHHHVRALTLDPARRYQPSDRPRGPRTPPTVTCQG